MKERRFGEAFRRLAAGYHVHPGYRGFEMGGGEFEAVLEIEFEAAGGAVGVPIREGTGDGDLAALGVEGLDFAVHLGHGSRQVGLDQVAGSLFQASAQEMAIGGFGPLQALNAGQRDAPREPEEREEAVAGPGVGEGDEHVVEGLGL